MQAFGIVGVDPAGDRFTGMAEVEEQGLVQKLVAHPAIERLAVTVLLRFAGGDVMPVHLHLPDPCQDGVRGELGPVAIVARTNYDRAMGTPSAFSNSGSFETLNLRRRCGLRPFGGKSIH